MVSEHKHRHDEMIFSHLILKGKKNLNPKKNVFGHEITSVADERISTCKIFFQQTTNQELL